MACSEVEKIQWHDALRPRLDVAGKDALVTVLGQVMDQSAVARRRLDISSAGLQERQQRRNRRFGRGVPVAGAAFEVRSLTHFGIQSGVQYG